MMIDTKEVISTIEEIELKTLKVVDSEYSKGIITAFSQVLIQKFEDYAEKEMDNMAKER